MTDVAGVLFGWFVGEPWLEWGVLAPDKALVALRDVYMQIC